jgi:hypothetical protein
MYESIDRKMVGDELTNRDVNAVSQVARRFGRMRPRPGSCGMHLASLYGEFNIPTPPPAQAKAGIFVQLTSPLSYGQYATGYEVQPDGDHGWPQTGPQLIIYPPPYSQNAPTIPAGAIIDVEQRNYKKQPGLYAIVKGCTGP